MVAVSAPMPLTQFSFVRSAVLFILLGLGALLAIVAATLWMEARTEDFAATLAAARQERTALIDLLRLVQGAETGQRGYLLTSNADYLAPYNDAVANFDATLRRAHELVRGDPSQGNEFDRLDAVLNEKMRELKSTVELFNGGQTDAALALVKTNRGRELIDEAAKLFAALIATTDREISARIAQQTNSIVDLRWITLIGALFIIAVVGGSAWTVASYTSQLVAARAEVEQLNFGLEQRIKERTEDLGRANAEIQRFAHIVTHDLRAPLVNIMGFTSELETSLAAISAYAERIPADGDDQTAVEARTAITADLPEAIGFIRSSTRKMDGLINAILKLSREGRRTLTPEPIDLDALLQSARSSVQHQVDAAAGEVVIEGRISHLISDRLALEQIAGNLLDNAVKYRSLDRPLKIRIVARNITGDRISIAVEDNGRGIAGQDHDRVFDLFRRSGTQDQTGEGIGLAYVRTVVRSLGGDITLGSVL
ncbi:MAG TPA: CHASE3 domain-containing protein, partial [Beijerinckiaceae bacterium]|nr:CHASE3 domain-containing protein [Beijerinckiaceae bacterium]